MSLPHFVSNLDTGTYRTPRHALGMTLWCERLFGPPARSLRAKQGVRRYRGNRSFAAQAKRDSEPSTHVREYR
jgi:hypothetical protein